MKVKKIFGKITTGFKGVGEKTSQWKKDYDIAEERRLKKRIRQLKKKRF